MIVKNDFMIFSKTKVIKFILQEKKIEQVICEIKCNNYLEVDIFQVLAYHGSAVVAAAVAEERDCDVC